jgi:2-dehydropantoate 2-reductase
MTTHPLKYLIAGTGGVGGSIAAFLALAGKDVTCIARGEHLAAIRENGLQLHSDLKGEYALRVPAYTAEEYTALVSTSADYKADVIFVCVKGYSVDSITELIKSAAHEHTVVIPILNVYGTGPRIQRLVPGVTVLDGCIYIVGFVSGRGEITQMGKIFRLVYGAHRSTIVSRETLEAVQRDLQESGIKADISDDIDRDTFVKWSFISAMAVTGGAQHLHRTVPRKCSPGQETGHSLQGRHCGVQPQSNRQTRPRKHRLHAERYGKRTSERSTRLAFRHDYSCRGARN